MHLGLTGTAWALGSCRISQHLSTLRALGSVFLPLLYFLVSLLYFCCSFLSGSFVIFLFYFFFLPCLAMLLAYILPPSKKKNLHCGIKQLLISGLAGGARGQGCCQVRSLLSPVPHLPPSAALSPPPRPRAPHAVPHAARAADPL